MINTISFKLLYQQWSFVDLVILNPTITVIKFNPIITVIKFNPIITAYLVPYIREGYTNKKLLLDESTS